ncbi:MAG: hypothetical protein ACYCO0_04100 [Candidatus Micrarchaeaceae archaeon]
MKIKEETIRVTGKRVMLEAREAEGRKAFKEFMTFLTKKDIKNIEQSVKEFHANFKLG